MPAADERRAGAAILKDLALFNKAVVFFEGQIDPTIRLVVADLVSEWLKKNGWKGDSDVSSDFVDMWVCPAVWEEEGEPLATFNFGYRAGIRTNSYQIADLFGVGQSDFGFRFEANYSWFGGKAGWNTFVKGVAELTEEIASKGWLNEGKGVFFRPVKLPVELLVSSWESDDWSNALAPLEQELDALMADQALFGKLIMKANPRAK